MIVFGLLMLNFCNPFDEFRLNYDFTNIEMKFINDVLSFINYNNYKNVFYILEYEYLMKTKYTKVSDFIIKLIHEISKSLSKCKIKSTNLVLKKYLSNVLGV